MNCFAVQKLSIIRGDLLLFKNLSFEINAGELLFVKGKNGSGKSTLLRTLLGLITPDEGQILWNKENINNLSIGEFMFYLGHQNGIKEEFSPRENLNFFWNFNDNTGNENNSENNKNKDIILDALKAFSIEKKHNIPCKYLSQGQKRRVALSRLVLENRPIWIL
ncbi:MAG: heme ABC exporter ATP-binding protein CcmA, partial [Rhodocyclaceae bacterium]